MRFHPHAHRLPLIELAEAELVIEIEDDEEFIAGPASCGGHGGIKAEKLKI
jgi:hypothetical protein